MANADSIEMVILPTATVTAMTALLNGMRPMFALPRLGILSSMWDDGRAGAAATTCRSEWRSRGVEGEGHHGNAGQEKGVDDQGVPVGGPPAANDHALPGQPGGLDGSGADGAHE